MPVCLPTAVATNITKIKTSPTRKKGKFIWKEISVQGGKDQTSKIIITLEHVTLKLLKRNRSQICIKIFR